MWQPLGNEKGGLSEMWLMSSESGTSGGRLMPARSLSTSSMMPMPRSVPAMVKRPRANSMSTGAASSTWAAICLPLSISSSPASRKAWLATSADFEPPVPPPTLS